MKMKRMLCVLLAALMLPAGAVHAEAGESLTKTVLANVALFKPVKASCDNSSYAKSNMADDDFSTLWTGDIPADDPDFNGAVSPKWLQVDLQRRCPIERIELWDRRDAGNTPGSREHFEIIGANCEDLSDGVRLGGLEEADTALFPKGGKFTLELPEKTAYRYVCVRKTQFPADVCYSEIKVYAMQTVTEVSREKPVLADTEFHVQYSAKKAVNGTNIDDGDCWISSFDTDLYRYLQVDLQKARYIGMVEIEGRNTGGGPDDGGTRNSIALYGANTEVDHTLFTKNAKIKDNPNYKQLTDLNNPSGYSDYYPFPVYNQGAGKERGIYRVTMDDSEPFRYLIYKKTYLNVAMVGQIRAFEINPTLLSCSSDGGALMACFSDEMDAGTVNPESLVLTRKDTGKTIDYDVEEIDGYDFRLIPKEKIYGTSVSVAVTDGVKSTRGVKAAGAEPFKISFPHILNAEDIRFVNSEGETINNLIPGETAGISLTAENLGETGEQTYFLAVCLYDADNTMISVSGKTGKIAPSAKEQLTAELVLPGGSLDGYTLSAYFWDGVAPAKRWIDSKKIGGQ